MSGEHQLKAGVYHLQDLSLHRLVQGAESKLLLGEKLMLFSSVFGW